MRYFKQMLYGALALGAFLALRTTVSAQEICDDTTHPITACSTVDCSLLVPPNATCTLKGVQVTGNIIVESGASLITENDFSCSVTPTPSVGGNVIATNAACISFVASSVGGNFIATGTTSNACGNNANQLCTSRVGGNVEILGSSSGVQWCIPTEGACGCGPSPAPLTVGGNFEFENNQPSATLPGTIMGDTIRGNLLFENNTEGGIVQGDHVGGNLTYDNNSGGANDVQSNRVGGNLQMNNNRTSNTLNSNTANGNIQFNNNSSSNTATNNHAGGNFQCNSTPLTHSGNTAGGVIPNKCK